MEAERHPRRAVPGGHFFRLHLSYYPSFSFCLYASDGRIAFPYSSRHPIISQLAISRIIHQLCPTCFLAFQYLFVLQPISRHHFNGTFDTSANGERERNYTSRITRNRILSQIRKLHVELMLCLKRLNWSIPASRYGILLKHFEGYSPSPCQQSLKPLGFNKPRPRIRPGALHAYMRATFIPHSSYFAIRRREIKCTI